MTTTMAERLQIYKCQLCSTMIEVVRSGGSHLTCCGQPMTLVVENTVDAAREKHVPVIERLDGAIKVSVGSIAHPMEEAHFIEWIELLADGVVYRRYLAPGEAPTAIFPVSAAEVSAREHCNLHGLWKGV